MRECSEKVYFPFFTQLLALGVYKKDDASRKPRPGMIYQAQKEINLNLENSILIGDKASDISGRCRSRSWSKYTIQANKPLNLESHVKSFQVFMKQYFI